MSGQNLPNSARDLSPWCHATGWRRETCEDWCKRAPRSRGVSGTSTQTERQRRRTRSGQRYYRPSLGILPQNRTFRVVGNVLGLPRSPRAGACSMLPTRSAEICLMIGPPHCLWHGHTRLSANQSSPLHNFTTFNATRAQRRTNCRRVPNGGRGDNEVQRRH